MIKQTMILSFVFVGMISAPVIRHAWAQEPPDGLEMVESAPDIMREPGEPEIELPGEDDNEIFELLAPIRDVPVPDQPVPAAPGLISVSFDEVPVPDVVNMFARISGANIIVAGTFTNYFVTANLRNVQWRSALNLVLGSVGLSTIEDPSGIIMVVTSEMYQDKLKQLEDTKPLITRVFNPQYLNPVDLVQQIRDMNVLSPRGRIITSQSEEQHLASLKSSETTVRPFATSERKQNPSITTSVVVTDIAEYVDRVAALITELDRREPQVFIEARIIDITTSDGSKVGFDWEMLDSFGIRAGLEDLKWTWSDTRESGSSRATRDELYDRRSHSDEVNKRYDIHGRQYEETITEWVESPPESGRYVERTIITPTRSIDDRILRGRDITSERGDTAMEALARTRTASALFSVDQVSLMLSALKRSGNAKMLAHPQIIVGNRVEAKIHVGKITWQVMMRLEPGRTLDDRDVYSEEASPIDLGLKLWVIPEIDVANDTVRLTVNPEMTVFLEDLKTMQGSIYPVTSTRTMSTRVNVPSGETLVIGGLIEHEQSTREKRVPFLGDIPLLGLLFRHREEVTLKHNLIVMLTPTILDDSAPSTGYEAMGWQAVERFDMSPLAPSKAPSKRDVPPESVEQEDFILHEPDAVDETGSQQ